MNRVVGAAPLIASRAMGRAVPFSMNQKSEAPPSRLHLGAGAPSVSHALKRGTLAGAAGFEPTIADPKSAALPLGHAPPLYDSRGVQERQSTDLVPVTHLHRDPPGG